MVKTTYSKLCQADRKNANTRALTSPVLSGSCLCHRDHRVVTGGLPERGLLQFGRNAGRAAAAPEFAEPGALRMALANPSAIIATKAFRCGRRHSELSSAVSTQETKASYRAPKPRLACGPP
jgi:hypothetical protein